MVKALARAFRWRKMLDTGVHATLEDLAQAKGVAPSYVSRVLRLTLLAPEIVEAILDGRQPAELQLDDLLEGFPLEWERQAQLSCVCNWTILKVLPARKMVCTLWRCGDGGDPPKSLGATPNAAIGAPRTTGCCGP